jgi:acyl-CoA synthetase (AMP-forming)/AMP-acid ligase II
MNWIDNLSGSVSNKRAVIFSETEYSYSQLANQINVYKALVAQKIEKGKIVAILSDYNFESIALFFALFLNKNIVLPITTSVESEVIERLGVSGANYLIEILDGELLFNECNLENNAHSLIRELQNNLNSGLILFSSGSTGQPKAMIHNLDNLIDSYSNKKGKDLVFMIFLMFDHIGGLNTLLSCLSMGVTMVFPLRRDPEHICFLIDKYDINVLPTSPTFLNLLFISGACNEFRLSSLKLVTYGTEPMPDSLLLKLKDNLPNVKFVQTFGTSETGISQVSSKSSTSNLMKFDTSSIEYKVVKGELWLRSKTQILGYLNSSMDRFTTDGWFKTGDIVEISDGDYLKIVGRNSEIINVGGEKVFPIEVETVLFLMPEIIDCVVYGETNPITGQMVVAKIQHKDLKNIAQIKKNIVLFCSDKLARYKIPSKIILMDELEFSTRFKKKRNF